MIHLGIDPGVSGGIAALNDRGGVVLVRKMPETPSDLLDVFVGMANEPDYQRFGDAHAVLEAAAPFAPFGQRMGAVSAFTFGKGIGYLEMALLAAGIPYDRIRPQRWQTSLGCLTRGDKNISKARAQALFPSISVTHAIADALLMAEFCRRFLAGSSTRSATTESKPNGKAQSTSTGKGARPKGDAGKEEAGRREGRKEGRAARGETETATAARNGHPEDPHARSHLRVARGRTRTAQR